jgi:hypothetical protein
MPLRLNPTPRIERIGPVRIYLDDLEHLVEEMRKHGKEVKIMAGNSTADEAEDLRAATRRQLGNVVIQSKGPDVDVFLGRKYRSSCVASIDETTAGHDLMRTVVSLLRVRETDMVLLPEMVTAFLCTYPLVTIIELLFFHFFVEIPQGGARQTIAKIVLSASIPLIMALLSRDWIGPRC